MKDKDTKKSGWGIALMIIGGVVNIVGFFMYLDGNPEGAGALIGAAERARRPRRRVYRRYNGLFGGYTETEYI